MNRQRKVVITITYNEMGIIIDTKAEEVAQTEKRTEERTETHSCDLISRQDAIEVAKQHWYKPDIAGALAELPSAQPEQRWIHVSERLPKIGREVLLSEPNAMLIAEYRGSGNAEGLWTVDECHHYLADVNKCAWMPLPEPYRAERREDE